MDDFLRNECKYLKCYQGIMYEPIPAPKTQPQERGQRSKNRNYER